MSNFVCSKVSVWDFSTRDEFQEAKNILENSRNEINIILITYCKTAYVTLQKNWNNRKNEHQTFQIISKGFGDSKANINRDIVSNT